MLSQFFRASGLGGKSAPSGNLSKGTQKENIFSKVMKKKKSATGHSNPNKMFAAFGKR